MDERQTYPTPERIAKGDLRFLESDRGGKEARTYGFSLDFYRNRSIIDEIQHMAGVRYGELWTLAYARHRFAQSRYGDPLTRGKFDPDLSVRSEEAFSRAAEEIRPLATRQLTFNVCVFGVYAGRGRIIELRGALDTLSMHFGYRTRK